MSKNQQFASQIKPPDYFSTEHLKGNLKQRSVRGGAITIVAQGSKFILQISSMAILGRLLTPNDYGLIGMVTPIIGFVLLFKDLGLSTATIQKEQINHRQVSTLFWINIAFSLAISILFAASAPLVASFYQEPRLVQIVLALSSIFLIGGLSIQHQALLKRTMQFTNIAKIEIASVLIGVIVGIFAAWRGLGYWSLVIMPLTKVLVIAVGSWIICRWRPGLARKDKELGSMLAFGGNLTGFNCINYFSRNLDNILIGQFWGAVPLGLYTKAYQLVLLPIQQINIPINGVALPLLSRLQNEPKKYTAYYYKFILAIVFLGMPIVAFTFAVTDKLILFVLGEQWLDAVPLFKFLVPAAFLGTFNFADGWVYQSLGRTDRQLKMGAIISTLDIAIFVVSVRWGVIAVAAAYGLSRPFIWLPRLVYCYHNTPLNIKGLAATLMKPTIASIAAALCVMALDSMVLENTQLLLALVIDGLAYGILYLAFWLILPQGKQTLKELLQVFQELKKSRKKAA